MKILVIQQKMIGDVLTSTILFEVLRKHYPEAELHYVVNAHTIPVLENNPFIDKLMILTPETMDKKTKRHRFMDSLREENYALVIDVYSKIGSALMAHFTKAKKRIGYHKFYTSIFYSHTVKRIKAPEHGCSLAIENRLKLLAPLGIPFEKTVPKIYLKNEEIDTAKTLLMNSRIALKKPLVMVSALGSSPAKTYPFEYMARLLDFCVETHPKIQFLFNYMPAQKVEAEIIYELTATKTQKRIFFNIFPSGLREFLALTAHCDALIGNEGGANNMAKALNVPTFTLFSPYLPKQNWSGESESKTHIAVHLSDYIDLDENGRRKAKKNPERYYLKFKPDFIKPTLNTFLDSLKTR